MYSTDFQTFSQIIPRRVVIQEKFSADFTPERPCSSSESHCWPYDMNLICEGQGQRTCQCRAGMRWNEVMRECQIFLVHIHYDCKIAQKCAFFLIVHQDINCLNMTRGEEGSNGQDDIGKLCSKLQDVHDRVNGINAVIAWFFYKAFISFSARNNRRGSHRRLCAFVPSLPRFRCWYDGQVMRWRTRELSGLRTDESVLKSSPMTEQDFEVCVCLLFITIFLSNHFCHVNVNGSIPATLQFFKGGN